MANDDNWPMSASAMNEQDGVHEWLAIWARGQQRSKALGRDALDAREYALRHFRHLNPRHKIRDHEVSVYRADIPIDPASL